MLHSFRDLSPKVLHYLASEGEDCVLFAASVPLTGGYHT
jgi:hypothetical protein